MKNFALSNIFEQTSHASLPSKALRIVTRVAKRYRAYSGSDQHIKAKQRQIAQAVLHMSLYQEFGPKCHSFMNDAIALLDDLLEKDAVPVQLKQHQFSWK